MENTTVSMPTYKWDWSDIAFWGSLLSILLWALAKTFGILHSPQIVEIFPSYAIVVTAVAAYYKIQTRLTKLEVVSNEKFAGVNDRLARLEHSNETINGRLLKVEHKVF